MANAKVSVSFVVVIVVGSYCRLSFKFQDSSYKIKVMVLYLVSQFMVLFLK